MPFTLCDVGISDAENIARHVEVPAMRNGPLYLTMFPSRPETTEAARTDQAIHWYANMLEDAFQDQWESFLKACVDDGTPVGFCGWTVIDRNRETEERNGKEDGKKRQEKPKKETWIPEAIDIDGWITLSRALKAERDRVLKDLDNVCRKSAYLAISCINL